MGPINTPQARPRFERGFALLELVAVLVVFTILAAMLGASLTQAATGEAIARNRAIAVRFADNAARLRDAWRLEGTGGAIEDFAGLADGTVDLNRGGWVVGRSAGPRDDVASVTQCVEILGVLAPAVRSGTADAGGDYQASADGTGGCIYYRLARGGGTIKSATGCAVQFRYVPTPGAASVSTACEDRAGPFYLLREE